jgi:hypothetical protein
MGEAPFSHFFTNPYTNGDWYRMKSRPTCFGDRKNLPWGKPLHTTNTATLPKIKAK